MGVQGAKKAKECNQEPPKEQESTKKWSVSVDTYDETTTFLVVHGILDLNEIEDWLDSTVEKTDILRKRNYFVVLSATYRYYQKNKTWKNNL